MNYVIEIIFIPSLIKTGSGIQKLMGVGIHRHTDSMAISLAFLRFLQIRKVG
jgi:hypothetical protein